MSSIKDVAKLAGVGVGTVSRVTNNSGYVSEATRKKVEDAIKQLGYEPNEMAKGLLASNSKIIALILPTIHHPLFSKFAYHVEQTLNSKGYKLFICNSDFEVEKELEYIRMLNKKIIDGIIFISNSNIDDYVLKDLPIVTIDRHLSNETIYISSDNYKGGELAAEHLVSKGCMNITFLGGFPNVETEVHKRKLGFINKLEELGMKYRVYEDEDVIKDMDTYLKGFWDKYSDTDGVFSVTDMMAYQLLRFLNDKGIQVPEQIKVIGYDGIDMFDAAHRELTTIIQPIDLMGEEAALSILGLVEKKSVKKKVILPVKLNEGQTT